VKFKELYRNYKNLQQYFSINNINLSSNMRIIITIIIINDLTVFGYHIAFWEALKEKENNKRKKG